MQRKQEEATRQHEEERKAQEATARIKAEHDKAAQDAEAAAQQRAEEERREEQRKQEEAARQREEERKAKEATARIKAEQDKAAQDAEGAASYQAIKLSISNFEGQSTEATRAEIDDTLAHHLKKSGKTAQESREAKVFKTVATDKCDGLQEVFSKDSFDGLNKPDEQKPAPQPNTGAAGTDDKKDKKTEVTLISKLMTKQVAFAALATVVAAYVGFNYGYSWLQAKRNAAVSATPAK